MAPHVSNVHGWWHHDDKADIQATYNNQPISIYIAEIIQKHHIALSLSLFWSHAYIAETKRGEGTREIDELKNWAI